MADCSYVRCVQERRFIKRELQKWTKSMVYIVGLERVAEELMGRRKWKLYQEVLARSHINTNSTSLAQNNTSTELLNHNNGEQQQNISQIKKNSSQQQNLENHSKENEVATVKCEAQEPDSGLTEISENQELFADTTIVKVEPNNSDINSRESKNITITDEDTEIGPQQQPVDWRPQDKCYFCVDGKLLAVNERGELVAEPGPVNTEPDLAHTTPLDSDSESSESCSEAEVQNSAAAVAAAASKSVAAFFRGSLPPNMTSFESIAVQLAAVASLQGLPTPFYPGLWYQQLTQQMPHATDSPVAAAANVATTIPTVKPSPSPNESIVNSEQPLDLSAKSSSSSGTTAMEPKHIFKAKPRMSALSGRRTYTEDELQNALQDILSGKLGTRRAAVLYGIPRSTLRNKVYKLAMEQKREANLHPLPTPGLADLDDEDKDLSGGEDEKEVEKTLNAMQLPQEELLRLSSTQSLAAAAMQKYSKLYDSSSLNAKQDLPVEQPKPPQTPTTPQTPTLPPNPWLDPNMLLQSLLLSGGLGALPGLLQPKSDEAAALPEFLRNLMLQQQELIKKQMESSVQVNEHMNNGKPSPDPRILMQNLPLVQQQQQHQQQQHHHQQHTQNNQQPYMNRVCKSETPETASSVDLSDINDDSAVILKIPSFKPVAGSSSTSVGKNGDSTPQSLTTTPLHSRSPQQSHLSGISPPLMRQSSESQSPPISGKGTLSLRDVIAKSISKTFQQMPGSEPDQYKKPSISVIKSIGDIRFGNSPNMLGNNSNNQSSSSTGTGGKGTRPKRGKYRNYDRDSLVEAVKAVQRGEMSVHRAGSYYGVPHSTLEYKVKERHLMRPRKREPKPQPLDERVGSSSSSVTNPKPSDIPSSATMRNALDKSKILSTTKPPMKTPPFPANSPNGLKMPFMDSAMQAQLQYAPHLFWPHPPGFGGLPMDFTRSPGATPTFPPNAADNFFASQMIQRFQEDSARHQQNSSSSTATSSTAVSLKTSSSATNNTSTPKTAREMAESLYDGTNANGSFLDGIIRHSLDRKPAEVAQGVLLEQLVKNSLPNSMTHNDSSTAIKRSGSPIPFIHEIKKERTSPPLMSSGHDSDRDPVDLAKESVEHLIKLRDGLTLRRGSTEDHNGSTTSNEDKMKLMSSDNEDSS